MMGYPISEEELHGYVDGELDAERRLEVEAYLKDHPEEAVRVRDFLAQNRAFHALYDSVLEEPLPRGMAQPKQPQFDVWVPRAAVAAVLLTVGAISGWFGNAAFQEATVPTNIASRAAVAHAVYAPETRHAVEVDAINEEHLVSWLSKRIGVTLKAPKLGEAGYSLVGGRLVPASSAPAAYFMYENRDGNRITLYVRARYQTEKKMSLRYRYQNGIGVFYWLDERLGYAVAGEMTQQELLLIAKLIQSDFND
ncbi:MAG: anti-sigma factor [Alphaproteobacteria bacterium]|nr:anti-sigma factor [Alphaproteobacteria bacterium]